MRLCSPTRTTTTTIKTMVNSEEEPPRCLVSNLEILRKSLEGSRCKICSHVVQHCVLIGAGSSNGETDIDIDDCLTRSGQGAGQRQGPCEFSAATAYAAENGSGFWSDKAEANVVRNTNSLERAVIRDGSCAIHVTGVGFRVNSEGHRGKSLNEG